MLRKLDDDPTLTSYKDFPVFVKKLKQEGAVCRHMSLSSVEDQCSVSYCPHKCRQTWAKLSSYTSQPVFELEEDLRVCQ